MRTMLKWFGILLLVIMLGVGGLLFGMRFHDGPREILPGGPFKSGELTQAPDDWTFLTDRMEIEFQTLTPDTSRVVWVAVVDSRLYIMSGYMTTGYGKIWKQWPHYMDEDNRVILRIDGKLYEQKMQRHHEHPQLAEIVTAFANKYNFPAPEDPTSIITSGYSWLYEVVDR